jgi:hypothetical protein
MKRKKLKKTSLFGISYETLKTDWMKFGDILALFFGHPSESSTQQAGPAFRGADKACSNKLKQVKGVSLALSLLESRCQLLKKKVNVL